MNQKELFKILQDEYASLSERFRKLSEGGVPDMPNPPAPPPPVDIPPGQKMKVLITFVGLSHDWTPPIDVMINGEWFHFYRRSQNSSLWNQKLHGSRGQIVEVNAPVKNVRFKLDQIHDSNHKSFNYKLGAVFPDVDMTIQNDNQPESPNYWASWFRIYGNNYPQNPKDFVELADHVSAIGTLSGKIVVPFYEYENIPASWSQTGQFRIIVGR